MVTQLLQNRVHNSDQILIFRVDDEEEEEDVDSTQNAEDSSAPSCNRGGK